jgi:hypothetical protein
MTNHKRLAAIATDEDFQAFLKQWEARLTAKVMARATSDDDRAAALSEYHALQSLRGQLLEMVAEAKQQKE